MHQNSLKGIVIPFHLSPKISWDCTIKSKKNRNWTKFLVSTDICIFPSKILIAHLACLDMSDMSDMSDCLFLTSHFDFDFDFDFDCTFGLL